jgi:VWFA-related protein
VSLVTVPVTVTDISGRFVPDLKPSEFHIFENDQVQKIDRLITAAQPFDVALMLDTSASMFMKAEEIQLAALRFVDALRRDDRLVIASFNDRVFVHSELEGDPAKIRPAILQIGRGEGTRVYDAIDLVMRDRLDAPPGRKAIVLFTDGADTRSRIADAAAVLARMQESQVLAYAIQYDTRKENRLPVPNAPGGQGTLAPKILPREALDTTAMYARATEFLRDLSETSGGRVYRAQALKDLDQAFAQIAEELSLQYTLCYYPRNQNKDGTFRRIRVEVYRPGVKIRARPGYLAARKPW